MHGVAQRRHILGARHGVIHERAGDELAAVVVDRALHQRLADALRQRALQLALDDHGIERRAAIVDRGIGDNRHVSGIGIDLDLGDVTAVGKRQRRFRRCFGVEVLGNLAALFHVRGARGDRK